MNTVLNRKLEQMPDLAEFITTDKAAKMLGYNVQSVRRMIRNGTLKSEKFGRVILVPVESLKSYLGQTREMSKNDPRRGQIK
jgi:excisionase family DNA binding protein